MPSIYKAATAVLQRSAPIFDHNLPYTMMLWVRAAMHPSSYWGIIATGDEYSTVTGDIIFQWVDNSIVTRVYSSQGNSELSMHPLIPLNTWIHLALVHRSDNVYEAYVNGLSVGTLAAMGGKALATRFWIGAFGWASSSGFDGCVTNAKVWTHALTGPEVLTEAFSLALTRTANLWAHYPLIAAGDYSDVSGNERHFIVSGGGAVTTSAETPPYIAPPPIEPEPEPEPEGLVKVLLSEPRSFRLSSMQRSTAVNAERRSFILRGK
jgi:hypothetical protein